MVLVPINAYTAIGGTSLDSYLDLCHCEECPLKGSVKVLGCGPTEIQEVWSDIPVVKEGNTTGEFIHKKVKTEIVVGGPEYDLVFVGIFPAKDEVKQGKPMVGWSGQVLRSLITKMKLKSYYLTNTFLCYYPEASEILTKQLKEEGNPTLTETEYTARLSEASSIERQNVKIATICCKDRLFAEIKSINPALVVAMGNGPLEAVTGIDHKIMSVQGRILPGSEELGIPVLPITHPAALRRRPDEFYDLVNALQTAPKFLNNTYQLAGKPETVIIDDSNILELCQRIEAADLVAVDLETTTRGFYPYGRDPDKIRCIAIALDGKTAYIVPGFSSPNYEEHPNYVFNPHLMNALNHAKLLTHNGPFDIGFLKQAGYNPRMFFDTFLAHYLLDERKYAHGLKPLCHRFLGWPDWEDDIKVYLPNKQSSYDLVPDKKLYEYASYDVTGTFMLSEGVTGHGGLRDRISNQRVFRDLLMPCANMFSDIRHRGFKIDVGYLMDLDGVLEKEYDEAVEELEKLANEYVNPLSPQDVARVLYDDLKFPMIPRYGRSTSKNALRAIGGPLCDGIVEARGFSKLKSTYVVGVSNFVDYNFRIHPFTNLTGAVTGRIATEDPSVMNVTKKGGVKKLYVPDDGHLIMEADQKQMEFRAYAVLTDDKHMKDLFARDVDIHMEIAKALARQRGVNWDEMTPEQREDLRQLCKSGAFGRLYGRGLDSFKRGYKLDDKGAIEFVKIIDQVFPSIKAYNEEIKREIHTQGFLDSYFGRRRHFGLILDDNRSECYRQGSNYKVQSMASDINLFAMLHLYEMRDQFGIQPMFPVHDSVVMDIPNIDVIPDIERELITTAQNLVDNEMVFKVDIAVGKTWGDTKKVKIKDGKVVV